jgi:hypothetical protein
MPRLRLGLIVLLVLTPWVAFGQASQDTGGLRAAAGRLLADGSADDAVKAADLLDKALQIEARAADIANESAQSKTLDQEIENGLVPLISTLVLAATLVFNIFQARATQREARADRLRQDAQDQDKRFNDALDLMLKSENFSPAAALISSFMDGPYQDRARAAGISLMQKTHSFATFKDLFTTLLTPITVQNMPKVIDLLRSIQTMLQPLLDESWTGTTRDLNKLPSDKRDAYDLLLAERMFVSQLVAAALRRLRFDPNAALDLSGLGFDSVDLSGLDLRGAVIDPANWNFVNLDRCDLRGIVNFSNCWFFNTAWWHVSAIDGPFLEHLKTYCAYKEGDYPMPVSQADYDTNVARLERGAI